MPSLAGVWAQVQRVQGAGTLHADCAHNAFVAQPSNHLFCTVKKENSAAVDGWLPSTSRPCAIPMVSG